MSSQGEPLRVREQALADPLGHDLARAHPHDIAGHLLLGHRDDEHLEAAAANSRRVGVLVTASGNSAST